MPEKKTICTCGKTKTPPYCDGSSHDQKEAASSNKTLCTCGKTKTPPYCDGSSHDKQCTGPTKLRVKSDTSKYNQSDFDF